MAKKFQFRLDVVRDVRKRARDEAARLVAVKVTEVTTIQQRVEEFSRQLRETVDMGRSNRAQKTVEIAALKLQQYYGKWLHDRLTDASSTLRMAEEKLTVERIKLTEASAKLKAIEKLRERKWQQHVLAVRKEEQAVTDEVAGRMGQTAKKAAEVAST